MGINPLCVVGGQDEGGMKEEVGGKWMREDEREEGGG